MLVHPTPSRVHILHSVFIIDAIVQGYTKQTCAWSDIVTQLAMLLVATSGRPKPTIALRSVANTRALANYAGGINVEGPGSGKRKTPPALGQQFETVRVPGPSERFAMLSAAEMERNFPIWVHSSTPPAIVDQEPAAGFTALSNPSAAAGPNSGRRR